jgi:hypothetical protein
MLDGNQARCRAISRLRWFSGTLNSWMAILMALY